MKAALLGRDPRNQDHIRAAFAVVQTAPHFGVTPKTAQELESLAVRLPEGAKIMPVSRTPSVVMASHFLLEEGKFIEDNIILQCSSCRHPIQLRPYMQAIKLKLCCFCAADRVIAERNAAKPKRKKKESL